MLNSPATINLERRSAPAVGITQAVYPVPQHLKPALLVMLLQQRAMHDALVFTRTKHRANRLAEHLVQQGLKAERIHGNRSQAQRTEALAGFKSGKYRVLVATDIAARGIDVTALGHVVNFDVPAVPDDYIHRVGRTARAEMTGDGVHVRVARRRRRPARDREGDRQAGCRASPCPISTTRRARRRGSKCRWRSESRRSEPGKHRSAAGRKKRRLAAPGGEPGPQRAQRPGHAPAPAPAANGPRGPGGGPGARRQPKTRNPGPGCG